LYSDHRGGLLAKVSHQSVYTFHVGLDLPEEFIRLGAVKQGPDGRDGVQDDGLRVGINVLLKEKPTPG
jgi:hypothetical protein